MSAIKDNRPASDGISEADIKIAEAMLSEGKTLPPDLKTAYDAAKGSQAPAKADTKEDDAPIPAKEEVKIEPTVTEKPKNEPEAGAVEAPKHRPIQTIPLAKYLETERTAKEAKARIAELETQLKNLPEKSNEDYESEVADLAASLGLGVDEIKKLDTFFAKRHALPPEIVSAIQATKQEAETKNYWDGQYERFDQEIAQELMQLETVDPNEAQLFEQNKEKIKELAFTDGYHTKSTWEIWTRFIKPTLEPNRKSIEVPSDGSAGGSAFGTMDWEAISKNPAKIRALDTVQFAEFEKWMLAQSNNSTLRPRKTL